MRSNYACAVKCNEVIINSCQFNYKYPHYKVENTLIIYQSFSIHNVGVAYFNNCQIVNYDSRSSITIRESRKVTFSHCVFYNFGASIVTDLSDITVEHCKFNEIWGPIFNNEFQHAQPQPITVIIKNTTFNSSKLVESKLMSFSYATLLLIGPVRFIESS